MLESNSASKLNMTLYCFIGNKRFETPLTIHTIKDFPYYTYNFILKTKEISIIYKTLFKNKGTKVVYIKLGGPWGPMGVPWGPPGARA